MAVDWYLIMICSVEVIQGATRPWAVSSLMIIWLLRCSPSCKNNSTNVSHEYHCVVFANTGTGPCWVFMPMPRQRIGLVLPTNGRKVPKSWQGHQAHSWVPSPSHRHFLESWVVITELLISQRWVQAYFPAIPQHDQCVLLYVFCKDWKDFRFFLILLDPLRSTRLLTAQPPSGNISLLGKSNWLGLDQNSAEWSPGNLKCWCVVLNKLHEQASYCLFVAGQRSTATDFSIFASCRAFAIDLPPRVITKLENRMRHSVLALVLLLRKLEPAPQQPGC